MPEPIAPDPLTAFKQVLIVVVAYLVAEVFLVACAYLWVFVYSLVFYSGGDNAYYEAYAQVSSPIAAVVLAGPTYFVIGLFMRRRFPDHALRLALAPAVVGFIVAMPLVIATVVDDFLYNVVMVLLSTLAALVGAYLGARPAR